jgi:hypothetical protein
MQIRLTSSGWSGTSRMFNALADLTAGRSTLYRACARTGRAYIGVDTDLMNVAHAGRMAEELCSISD